MSEISNYIRHAVLEKPIEAKEIFDSIVSNKIETLINQSYDNFKSNFFDNQSYEEQEIEGTDDEE